MTDLKQLDQLPENTVVLSGESLLSSRHSPVPPNFTTVIRTPQNPLHLYELLREEYPSDHPIQICGQDLTREGKLENLNTEADCLDGADYLIIPPTAAGESLI